MYHQYTAEDIARFWGKVNKEISKTFYNGIRCWEWTASLSNVYGRIRVGIKTVGAHRFSYEIMFGKIPQGFDVLHHCDNPSCVNPSHLFLGTDQDNADDKVRKGRQARTGAFAPLRGEANGNCKLSDNQVQEIRRRYSPFGVNGDSLPTLAREFGVSWTQIRRIVNRESRT